MVEESQYVETFRIEAYEHLKEIENALLDLEENPIDRNNIHKLFRAMHTIKGSGAMFGMDEISGFAHHLETLIEKVRERIIPVTTELIDLILLAKDQLKSMLDEKSSGIRVDAKLTEKIIRKTKKMLSDISSDGSDHLMDHEVETSFRENAETVFRIRFKPDKNIMASGMDPALVIKELMELGKLDILPHMDEVPDLESLNSEKTFIFWDMILSTPKTIDDIKDVFIFVDEKSEINIQAVDMEKDPDTPRPRIGEILVNRGEISEDAVDEILKKQKRIGQLLVESGKISGSEVKSALMEQKIIEKRKSVSETGTIRISSTKLDTLINLVGEIVVTQAHLTHLAEDHGDSVFSLPVKQMERLTGDLRELALDMRMLPVSNLFGRFRRLVRDLSTELGKEVDLAISGGDTELDKTILDRLHDPMVHLLRNAIDHGIETPDEREASGKQRKGTIRLSAAHRGARVQISVVDDGKGIDLTSVLTKAVEKNLVAEADSLTETDIYDMLFAPGFSTADQVTDVSGRGVGMDVVKQEINALGGTIEIESSPGQGSRFNIFLPLTLAIIEGLHIRVDGRDFIIPVAQVELCSELKHQSDKKQKNQNTIRLKDELIPYIRLRSFFDIPDTDIRTTEHLAAVRFGHHRIGIIVDEILGNIQTVIKPLDPIYRNAEGISGATVLGNGTVALIIDIPELIRSLKK